MSSMTGNKLKISIFGESHGEGIGVVIDGLPSGFALDFDYINQQMNRRLPGTNTLSTERKEKDEYKILSGLFEGKTTGTPLSAILTKNLMIMAKDSNFARATAITRDISNIHHIMTTGGEATFQGDLRHLFYLQGLLPCRYWKVKEYL